MQLLLKRDQTASSIFSLLPLRIGSGVTFLLHAELELDAEEAVLIQRYNFTKATLVESDLLDDLRQSFRPASLLGFVAFLVLWLLFSFSTASFLAILVTVAMTVVYFKTLREQIVVSELMAGGRTFRCDSIVALIKKEAFLANVSAYLRQVLESAKHWGDREALPILPLSKEEAKQVVLRS